MKNGIELKMQKYFFTIIKNKIRIYIAIGS